MANVLHSVPAKRWLDSQIATHEALTAHLLNNFNDFLVIFAAAAKHPNAVVNGEPLDAQVWNSYIRVAESVANDLHGAIIRSDFRAYTATPSFVLVLWGRSTNEDEPPRCMMVRQRPEA